MQLEELFAEASLRFEQEEFEDVAYFEPNTTEECVGLELFLTNASVGEGLEYLWDFGNGNTFQLVISAVLRVLVPCFW